jgi:hypothetical protein
MKIFKHLRTINRHRRLVVWYCFRCGLYKQGLLHDLSKYRPIEFLNGAKYYLGTGSPHSNERADKGYSEAWMHHKGRNKHHVEYWFDYNVELGCYAPVVMPKRYIAESICDRIAASKNYYKKNYTRDIPLDYFNRTHSTTIMHEDTKKEIETLLTLYRDNGEKYIFKYLKKNYRKK